MLPTSKPTTSPIEGMIRFISLVMHRHPIRNRLGLLPAEMCVSPKKHEEAEVQDGHHSTKQVFPGRQVDVAEPFRNHLSRDTGTHCAEAEERQHEHRQPDLVAGAAVADRLDLAAI